jgi:Ran-binding protein 1
MIVAFSRAKMYRFDKEANEWKERGTGDLKLLKNAKTGQVRVLMRREKTHKICANHLVVEGMELKASVGSDKSWLYQTVADFSEGESRPETLTVRFANADHAKEFKAKFDEAKETNKQAAVGNAGDDLADKVSSLKIDEKKEDAKAETHCKKSEEPKDEETCQCPKDDSCKEKCVGCKCGCQN